MADGFKVADAYVNVEVDDAAVAAAMRRLPKTLDGETDQAGRGLGNKLSQGMNASIIRNSPLIAAAVGGALAAGAPLALTGATALFAGIGIAAAAQSDKVQSAWLGAWQGIRDGAISDALPIEGV